MRRSFGFVAFILMVFGSGVLQAQNWREFNSESGRFRVEMPGTPVVQTKSDAVLTVVKTDNIAFIVAYVDNPEMRSDPRATEAALEGAVAGVADGNKLEMRRTLLVSGYQGREFLVTMPGDHVLLGRATVVGKRMYQIFIVGFRGAELTPDAKRFLESFAVLAQ